VPVVVAGGAKMDTYKDVLELTYNSLQAGAIGVDMGRNIWQSEYPSAILQSVKAIIHGNASVKDAVDMVTSLSTDENRRRPAFEFNDEDMKSSSIH
jgi:3-hydroxy-5-phosphonooxypentane-2,4-dione thiolase